MQNVSRLIEYRSTRCREHTKDVDRDRTKIEIPEEQQDNEEQQEPEKYPTSQEKR